jgi:hypothetical protein
VKHPTYAFDVKAGIVLGATLALAELAGGESREASRRETQFSVIS